jgi:hypothetical protein
MKKSLIVAFVVLLLQSAVSTVMAAPADTVNPFVDVPANHWAYDAVSKLQTAGIVDGYDDRTFRGDKTITRYEMAVFVARAISRSDRADKKNQEIIAKLQQEFSLELTKMGVRLKALEKKSDNAMWSGEVRTQYNYEGKKNSSGVKTPATALATRARLMVQGKINQDWSYFGRYQNTVDLRQSSSSADSGTVNQNYSYLTGSIGSGLKASVGRIPYVPAYGLLVDSTYNGIGMEFTKLNHIGLKVYYGRESKTGQINDGTGKYLISNDVLASVGNTMDTDMYAVELASRLGNKTHVKAAYLEFKGRNKPIADTTPAARMWEAGFDTKLNKDWTIQAVYGKSNAQMQNKANIIGVAYKSYDLNTPKSYKLYADYRNFGRLSTFNSTYNIDSIGNILEGDTQIHGVKGISVGANYVFARNILLNVSYLKGEATDGSDYKDNMLRAQMHMFF